MRQMASSKIKKVHELFYRLNNMDKEDILLIFQPNLIFIGVKCKYKINSPLSLIHLT